MSIEPRRRENPAISIAVHIVRCCLVAGLLLLLPSPHAIETASLSNQSPNQSSGDSSLTLDQVRQLISDAAEVSKEPDGQGVFQVFDQRGISVGRVARSSPDPETIIGYRGPTEALMLVDDEDLVVATSVMFSHDTDEHVEAVKGDAVFLNQFTGWRIGETIEPEQIQQIDGVSGATLTSMAMAEGIIARLGKVTGSLVFADPLSRDDAEAMGANVKNLNDKDLDEKDLDEKCLDGDPIAKLAGDRPQRSTYLARSGWWVDDEVGYQGPTELLLAFDAEQRLSRVKLRSSFDNQPYVDYVRQERSFWKPFEGKSIDELAAFDLVDAGVEGVSGATMTSMAVAYTLTDTAMEISEQGGVKAIAQMNEPASGWARWATIFSSIHWTPKEIVTLGMLLVLLIALRLRWFRHRWIRRTWLLICFVVLGLWAGNLVSLALLAGWASSGIGWKLAIGLFVLVLVAMLSPPASKGNPYCNHLCPHGSAQQLLRPTKDSFRRFKLGPRTTKLVACIPSVLLMVAYLLMLFQPSFDLSLFEPFDGYSWQIVSLGSIAFAVITLVASSFIPMAYCRMGCPTGRLLDYLRRSKQSGKITHFDFAVLALMLIALAVRLS